MSTEGVKQPTGIRAGRWVLGSIALALALLGGGVLLSQSHEDGASLAAAEKALAEGRSQTARVDLLNLVERSPGDPRLHLMLARVQLGFGDGVSAESQARKALALGAPAAAVQALRANALLLQNRPADAIAETVRMAPADAAEGARIRGLSLALLGRLPAAAKELQSAIVLTPGRSELWSDLGRVALAQGDPVQASRAAARATQLDPASIAPLLLQGDAARVMGHAGPAQAWYDRVLQRDPANLAALHGKAAILDTAGAATTLLAVTRRIQARSPKDPVALYYQAKIAANAGRFELAQSLLERASASTSGDPATLYLTAYVNHRMGNDGQSVATLNKLLEIQPGSARVRQLLALALLASHDPAGAAAALQPVVRFADADRRSLEIMANVLARSGDRAAAATYLARAKRPSPRRLINTLVVAETAARRGDWITAVNGYDQLRRQTRDGDAKILNNLAWSYAQLGNPERALLLARKAYQLAPSNPSIVDTYAWLLHGSGSNPKMALALLRSAAQRDPSNATIQQHLMAVSRG